jgi:hypothetical protein
MLLHFITVFWVGLCVGFILGWWRRAVRRVE